MPANRLRSRRSIPAALLAAALLLLALPAAAATVQADLDVWFAGTSPGKRTPPFGQAVFRDVKKSQVEITLSLDKELRPTAYATAFYLNFGSEEEALDPAKLAFTVDGDRSTAKPSGIFTGRNAFSFVQGSGSYDILLAFSSRPGERLAPGGTVVLNVTSDLPDFSALQFLNLSCKSEKDPKCVSGPNGPFVLANELDISSAGSWLGASAPVPLPASVWLLMAGLAAFSAAARRKR